MKKLYDKNGIELLPNDVLKVFHFVGARRKKHYMYKQVFDVVDNEGGYQVMRIEHLEKRGSYYHLKMDGTIMNDVEIVQGYGTDHIPFYRRVRL